MMKLIHMCAHAHTHIHAHIHAHTHTRTHTHTHTHTHSHEKLMLWNAGTEAWRREKPNKNTSQVCVCWLPLLTRLCLWVHMDLACNHDHLSIHQFVHPSICPSIHLLPSVFTCIEHFHHVIRILCTRNKPPSWCTTCTVCY